MNDNKYDLLKLILTRYDHYLNGVNIKARFIIALFTFVITVTIYNVKIFFLVENNFVWWINLVALVIICVACFLGMYKVLSAVFPYSNSGNSSKDKYHSLIYFGSVKEFASGNEYRDKILHRSSGDDLDDLSNQIHVLASGLDKKYKAIQCAIHWLFVLGGATIVLILTKIYEVL